MSQKPQHVTKVTFMVTLASRHGKGKEIFQTEKHLHNSDALVTNLKH